MQEAVQQSLITPGIAEVFTKETHIAAQRLVFATVEATVDEGADGQFGGAATPEEARRSAQAVSLMRIGEAQRAIDLLAESLAQPSYDALTPYLMGEAQAAAGAWSEAIRYWETLLRTSYRPHVRLRLGEAYENNGDTTAAIESYRGFLAMWQEGDPALPPAVEATEALARLGG